MSGNQRILIVDDEEDILEVLKYNLSHEGYEVGIANNGHKALNMVSNFKPHLILLDIMMPGMDGIEVCEKIRSIPENKDILIAFLTARNEAFTHVTALETGGDDFINKPIKPNVLKARINALFRRQSQNESPNEAQSIINFGDMMIDFEKFKVVIKDNSINLAKKEFELLQLLTSKPGKVFKRDEILGKVWGNDVIVGDRTIDVHIRKLREKIGDDYIKTMKGVGYKFVF